SVAYKLEYPRKGTAELLLIPRERLASSAPPRSPELDVEPSPWRDRAARRLHENEEARLAAARSFSVLPPGEGPTAVVGESHVAHHDARVGRDEPHIDAESIGLLVEG